MRFKTVLLSSAALFGLTASAFAADLPTVEPDNYVRVCNAFGTGFFYIPGSDTCLKIGGYVRAEMHYVDGDTDVLFGPPTSDFNNTTSRARGNIHFDSQTNSDLGLIRAYVELQMTVGPGDFGDYSTSNPEIPEVFVQVSNDHGTFTAGHTSSFFDFYGSDDFGTRLDIDDSTTEQTLFAYTLVGPSGIRGTLSVEDPDSSGRRLDGTTDGYEGQELPDLVGNIRVDQEWGSAQVMGVVRQIHDSDGDGLGWAVSAGASATLPVANVGVSAQVGYADGAIAYITNDPGGVGDFSGPSGDDTNQAWMARAGVTAPLSSTIGAWLDGSFTHAEDDVNDDDYDFWAFVVGAAWSPNDALSMGPELAYNRLDGDDPGEDGEVWGAMWRVEASY